MTLNNIVLKHGYGQVFSRKNVNINICDKKGQIFDSPVILSNMPSVQNDIILKKFDKAYWPYVRHRIDGPEKIYDFVVKTNKEDWEHVSISIGVQDADLELIRKIKSEKLRIDWLTIDVAFIYNKNYNHFINDIRELIPSAYLIAGNFTNAHVLQWLKNLGVDAAKFGIGQSNLCFLGDTLVCTKLGFKQIKNINIEDEVLTHTGEYKPVIDKQYKYTSDLIEINGQICTPDHKFYVIKKDDENKINDENINKYAFWLEAKDIDESVLLISLY